MCSPLKKWRVRVHLFEGWVYIKLFGNLRGSFVSSSHLLIYSIIYFYQFELMNIYLIRWVITQYYLILLLKVFQLWLLLTLSDGICAPLIYFSYHVCLCVHTHMCVWAISYIMVLVGAPGSFVYFLSQYLTQPFFLDSTGSFYRRVVLKPKIWVLVVFVATGVLLLLGPLTWHSKEI